MATALVNTIPCDRCNTQIDLLDWSEHLRDCSDLSNNQTTTEKRRTSIDESDNIRIPCEYCDTPVSVDELIHHTNKCAQAEKQRIADKARRIAAELSDVTIPCESCNRPFSTQKIAKHQKRCRPNQIQPALRPVTVDDQASGVNFPVREYWDPAPVQNLARFVLDPDTEEYNFVANNFHKTIPADLIRTIERIQNRRWYRQYEAHKDDFIERYGTSTEQWLFHGCRQSESAEAIIKDCFNRSHAVNCAVGQGIYFSTQAAISYGYTQPDSQRLRHMFLARVLVGKTTRGNRSTRVCPPGFDTTGRGDTFVTYHDAQAYAQYLITFGGNSLFSLFF